METSKFTNSIGVPMDQLLFMRVVPDKYRILLYVSSFCGKHVDIQSVSNVLDIDMETARRRLKELCKEGLLLKSGSGEYWIDSSCLPDVDESVLRRHRGVVGRLDPKGPMPVPLKTRLLESEAKNIEMMKYVFSDDEWDFIVSNGAHTDHWFWTKDLPNSIKLGGLSVDGLSDHDLVVLVIRWVILYNKVSTVSSVQKVAKWIAKVWDDGVINVGKPRVTPNVGFPTMAERMKQSSGNTITINRLED